MRYSAHLFLAQCILLLAHPPTVPAQQRSSVFGGVRPTVAFVDHQRDATLQGTGFQVSAYVGRRFASDFAGLVDLGVTTVSHRTYNSPCTFPGCSGPYSAGEASLTCGNNRDCGLSPNNLTSKMRPEIAGPRIMCSRNASGACPLKIVSCVVSAALCSPTKSSCDIWGRS